MALAVLHRSLYAGGTITRADRRKVHHLAAFDTRTGALHRHWKPRTNGAVYTVRVAHGAVYAGGDFTKLNGNARGRYLAAVNPTSGALRRHYTSSVVYPIFDVAVKGKVVYAAADGPGGRLEALNLNGSGRWTVTTDGAVQAVAVLGGTVYAGGHFDHVCQTGATGVNGTCAVSMANRFKFMAVSTGGTLRPWAPQGNGLLGAVTLAADSHAQRLAAGGDFTKFHSTTTQPFFAQFG